MGKNRQGVLPPEEEEREVAVARLSSDSAIDLQVATAKKYPRSIAKFKQKALDMATLDEETAAACIYAVPRQGKTIEGPSARLAEIVASAWGNLRVEARTTNEDEKYVYAESVCWDLETNTAIKYETRRRITDRNGRKYQDDMVAVTANAACSIALRNAVFKVVPNAYTRDVYEKARAVAVGTQETLGNKRAKAFELFQKAGIKPDKILAFFAAKTIEDVGLEQLAVMRGVFTAIKDGELNIDNAFAQENKPVEKTTFDPSQIKPGKAEDNRGHGKEGFKKTEPEPQAYEPGADENAKG